jgi:hypothetical protein
MFETRVADLLQHAAGEYIHVRSSFPFFSRCAFALSFAHFSLSLSLSSSVRVLYIYIYSSLLNNRARGGASRAAIFILS